MKAPGAGRILIVLLLAAPGCVSVQERVRRDLEWSERAFRSGEVFSAYRRLSVISEVDPSQAHQVEELRRKVTEAAEFLIEQWVGRAAAACARKDLVLARNYLGDLIAELPPADPLKSRIAKQYSQVDQMMREVRARIDASVAEGRRAFLAGEYSRARDSLTRGVEEARAHHLPVDLAVERLAEEARRRAPRAAEIPAEDLAAGGEAAGAEAPAPSRESSKERVPVRRPHRPESSSRSQSASPPAEKATDPEEPVLARARERLEKNDLVGAVGLLREILRRAPDHAAALQMLRSLDAQRRRLVEELGRQAAEFFSREDLEHAAPLYRDILVLDPGNLRAKEGLQMYQKFLELKQKQR